MDEIIRRYKRDLAVRGYSERTCSAYLYYLKDFLKFTNYHGLPPEKDQLKDYLYHLISERKLSDSTIRQASASLKFYCTQTFGIRWQSMNLPERKSKKKLPVFYSFNEVMLILRNSANLKHKALLTIIYSSGLRLLRIGEPENNRHKSREEEIAGPPGKRSQRPLYHPLRSGSYHSGKILQSLSTSNLVISRKGGWTNESPLGSICLWSGKIKKRNQKRRWCSRSASLFCHPLSRIRRWHLPAPEVLGT